MENLGPQEQVAHDFLNANEKSKSPQWTDVKQLADKYDYFLLDCDGVVWSGSDQVDSAFEVVNSLESQGKHVYFISNNARKTASDAAEKMTKMGLKDPKLDHIYGSSSILAKTIRVKYPEITKVFGIGMKSMRTELENVGIEVIGCDEHLFDPSAPIRNH